MSLQNKNAIVYGAGGAVGGAVARAFARDGARVFLTGRDKGVLDALAKEILGAGGAAETAHIDATDEAAVASHLDDVVGKADTIDISFNAIGIPQQGVQGIPLTELSVESFTLPITTYPLAHFVTARAAARHMIKQRSGVILMHTPEPARLGVPLTGGMSPAWAAARRPQSDVLSGMGPPRRPHPMPAHHRHSGNSDDRRCLRPTRRRIWPQQGGIRIRSLDCVPHEARDHARRTRRCGRFRGLGSGRRTHWDGRQPNWRSHRRLTYRHGDQNVARSYLSAT
jgi:hypothetical protein